MKSSATEIPLNIGGRSFAIFKNVGIKSCTTGNKVCFN